MACIAYYLQMAFCFVWSCAFVGISTCSAIEQEESRQWAIVIGIEEHENPRWDLSYTCRDASAVEEVLNGRAGIPKENILTMTDNSGPDLKPCLDNIQRKVPQLLQKAKPQDRVIVFFSGHGHPVNGEIYLVPSDFQLAEPEATGFPASDLRQALQNCQARSKFLILDCCHAAGTKSVKKGSLEAATVAKAILPEPVAGTLVLASCRANEESYEWSEREHGLFTYWLCRALEGGADRDADGQITADEVYRYAYDRVTSTATHVLHRQQNPALYPITGGFPVVLTLRPEPPESLCRRLAEHVDLEIRRRGIDRVGVLEFLKPIGQSEGLAAANLPAYCAAEVREELKVLARDQYAVLAGEIMEKRLQGFGPEGLGDPERMQPLRRDNGVQAVVTGVLRRRGCNMHVQCDLISTEDGASLVRPGGILPLDEDLVGDSGGSFTNADRPSGGPYDVQVVSYAQSAQDHPMLLTGEDVFPFRVEVWSIEAIPGEKVTEKTPRKRKEFVLSGGYPDDGDGQATQTELIVPAKEGELFEIRVKNNYRERVAMTLLVDGINVLGQKRERLGEAWSWVLDPLDTPGETGTHRFEGWYVPKQEPAESIKAADFTVKRFQFVDLADSVAVRQSFTDSIGLITAAFYAQRGRSLGVGEGPEQERNLRTVDFHPGRLLGVINVRYMNEGELQ